MIHFDIISAVPALLESPFAHSILKRAVDRKLLNIHVHDLRAYGKGKHRQIDDYAFGGGAGMVMMIEPIEKCINAIKEMREPDEIIYLSPDGEQFDQKMANTLSLKKNIILLCGHYKGIDERIREHIITREISIGDFVLSGGELPAAVIVDAVARILPGALNDESSALSDSFQDKLVAPPVYTRPAEYNCWKVPDILRSGNDGAIEEWKEQEAIKRTQLRRPKLLEEE